MTEALTFGSVCSGIEAASVAWEAFGWRAVWLAEIEAFPSAALAQRFPGVPNLGDMTKIADRVLAGDVPAPDVLVGGTPCQAFSVAGLRAGLDDSRGQLTLRYMELANAIDAVRRRDGRPPCILVWENVPGVLSDKTNAFGCFLGGLAGEDAELVSPRAERGGRGWSNAGAVFGPQRAAAWRVLDAQYFGVAQRRRRVFVVASARPGFDPAAVLFESEGLRRDTPPSRGPGQDPSAVAAGSAAVGRTLAERPVTGTLSARANSGGGLGTDFEADGGLLPVIAPALTSGVERPRGDGVDPLVICMAHGQGGAEVAEDRSPTLTCNHEAPIACYAFQPRIARNGRGDMGDMVNALTAQAGQTGKGDAAPCVALAFKASHFTRGKDGAPADVTPPLSADADKGDQDTLVCAPVAFSCKDYGNDALTDCSPTLRAMGHSGSHANGGGQIAVAFDARQDCVSSEHVFGALGSSSPQAQAIAYSTKTHNTKANGAGKLYDGYTTALDANSPPPVLVSPMQVRRLTPRECERLQGFPDDWTAITVKGKPAADGPRYKALGNSMAVPCMRWIGSRILRELRS